MPSFDLFANFIKDEAEVATDPIFSREALRIQSSDGVNNKRKPPNYKVRPNPSKVESCILCKKEHDLDDCDKYFKRASMKDENSLMRNSYVTHITCLVIDLEVVLKTKHERLVQAVILLVYMLKTFSLR
jgi:hypothetical protein